MGSPAFLRPMTIPCCGTAASHLEGVSALAEVVTVEAHRQLERAILAEKPLLKSRCPAGFVLLKGVIDDMEKCVPDLGSKRLGLLDKEFCESRPGDSLPNGEECLT